MFFKDISCFHSIHFVFGTYINVLVAYASIQGSDECAQMHSLARASAARTHVVGPYIEAQAKCIVLSN